MIIHEITQSTSSSPVDEAPKFRSSSILNNLTGVGRSTAVFEFFMTTFEKIVTTGRTFKGWFTGSSTDTSPQINPPVFHQRHTALATAQQQSVEHPPAALQTGVETAPTPQVAEAKPSLMKRLAKSFFSYFPLARLAQVDYLRKVTAATYLGVSVVTLLLGTLCPPILPVSLAGLLLLSGLYFVVSYWAPELSEKMATAAAKLAEGQSEATQAKIGAGQGAATALINGGSQTVAAMTAGVGYILGWFGAKTNQTKRASAAINAGAVAAAHTEQISYQCNNPPIAQWSSTLSASIVAAFFGIDGSSKIGMAAADGAVLGDKWAAFLTCLSYGDIRGSLMLLAGHKMVDVGLSFLPKGIEKSTIQEYAGPVLKNAINVLCLDLKSQVIIMILPAVTSTMLATWCAFQQKPEGWLKQQMEQGRASALAAAKNVAESATETAKGAVVMAKNAAGAVAATETAKSAVVVVKNVAEVVESVTGKIDDNITKTCTLLNEEEIGGAINDAFQDAFQGGLFGPTETADPFEKPTENVNHMDDDDDNDEAPAPAMSAWTQTTKAIFSGFFGGDGISRAFEGLGMDDTEDPFETSAENANDMDDDDYYYDAPEEVSVRAQVNFETPAEDVGGMDDDDDDDYYYDAEEEVSGWERANTTKTDAPFETPAEDAKETPAASIWTKMVTARVLMDYLS